MEPVIAALFESEEPGVRYKTLTGVLGKPAGSPEVWQAQNEVRCSPRVEKMLSEQGADGRLPDHAYQKWTGAHWLLAILADIGYPPGDSRLIPLREDVLAWLLPAPQSAAPWRKKLVIDGRVRTCASQEGNALYAQLALGLADERAGELARGLLAWQWPDGGWNCDKNPPVTRSSFHETITPLRGLVWWARAIGDPAARQAAERAADVFLRRGMFRRLSDGAVMDKYFLTAAYPPGWHYDILFGLKVMAEGGWVTDPRCKEALDVLESMRLPDGGFAPTMRYYKMEKGPRPEKRGSQASLVDWGGTSTVKMNPWVTADALTVLRAAGR